MTWLRGHPPAPNPITWQSGERGKAAFSKQPSAPGRAFCQAKDTRHLFNHYLLAVCDFSSVRLIIKLVVHRTEEGQRNSLTISKIKKQTPTLRVIEYVYYHSTGEGTRGSKIAKVTQPLKSHNKYYFKST